MRRTPVLLAPFVVLPWLAAAPVPKREPDFTHSVTAELLAKLPFVNAGMPPRGDQGDLPVAVAVHLPRATFEEGDPIPALFVVKNRSDKPHGLHMEFDFPKRQSAGGGSIEVRNPATDAKYSPFLGHATMCGGGARSAIPANGYFALRGDVGVAGSGESLPVGDYELTWDYAWAKSNTVKFSVVSRRLGRPETPRLRAVSVFRLVTDDEEEGPKDPKKLRVEAHSMHELFDALSTGAFGAYHPAVRDLPSAGGGLRASAAWIGDKLTVTVDSPSREFDALSCREPAIFLLVEHGAIPVDSLAREKSAGRDKKATEDSGKLPFKVEFALPSGWKDKTGLTGECRVAVLVASREPPERSYGLERQLKVTQALEKVDSKEVRKTKAGDWVLRTEWQTLQFPKAVEKPKADE